MPHLIRSRQSHLVVVAPPAMGHAIPTLEFVKRLSSSHLVTLLLPAPFVDTLFQRGILQAEGDRAAKGTATAGGGGDAGLDFVPSHLRFVRLEGLPPFPEDAMGGLGAVVNCLRAYQPVLERCFREAAERHGWAAGAPAAAVGGGDGDVVRGPAAGAEAAGWWPAPPTVVVADFFCVDPALKAARAVPALNELPVFTLYPSNRLAMSDFFKNHSDAPDQVELPEMPDGGDQPDSKQENNYRKRCEFIDGTNMLKLDFPAPLLLMFSVIARGVKNSSGCLIDTFEELDQDGEKSCPDFGPSLPVYSVGPLCAWSMQEEEEAVRARAGVSAEHRAIMAWLDAQPPRSVVYVAFGSIFCLEEDQARELEAAMFASGHPFLWSLRTKGQRALRSWETRKSSDASRIEVPAAHGKSPALFVDWCPQRAVLVHPAIGGFISHCGWNSSIEAVCAGVPIVAWPLGAEQHVNAKYLVDRNIAVQIRQTQQFGRTVAADEILSAVRELFEGRPVGAGSRPRADVARDMAEKARRAIAPGGKSRRNLEAFPFR